MTTVTHHISTADFYSKAPLRLGFAGGGTDVSPYTEKFGGAVLNATISLYTHAGISISNTASVTLTDYSTNETVCYDNNGFLPVNGQLDLLKGVYNHFFEHYTLPTQAITIATAVDVPLGSGLGTSSTLVVALIGAFAQWLQLSFSAYEMAALAYHIERNQLGFAGGRQDQFAASFGGINFMEFDGGEHALVSPLTISSETLQELQQNLVLYYTGHSRQSGIIIQEQQQNVLNNRTHSVEAMHQLKIQARLMKDALLNGRLDKIGELFDYGFEHKRKMAGGISNAAIETIYDACKKAGATGGKISGAGGGGFMFFYCPNNSRSAVIETLNTFAGQVWDFKIVGS